MKAMESLKRVIEITTENPIIAGDFLFWVLWFMEDTCNDMSFIDYLNQTYLEQTQPEEKEKNMTDEQTEVTHKSTVVELLSCQRGLVGVNVKLKNAEVTGVRLTWLKRKQESSIWVEHDLPGGEEWLKDLHLAIGEMLQQIKRRKDRKNLMLLTSMISPRG